MDNNEKYSRKRNPKRLLPEKGRKYRRDEIIEGLNFPADYKGISHYFTSDGTEIYSFFTGKKHNNAWKAPFFTYETDELSNPGSIPENINDSSSRTRYVFYKGKEEKEAVYKYLGTTVKETANSNKITWEIKQ
jgi:hypothetical protein